MSYEDMTTEDQLEMRSLRKLLYRAVRELSYIEELAGECYIDHRKDLIATAEGAEIVRDGMKLLGCADLGDDDLPHRLVTA